MSYPCCCPLQRGEIRCCFVFYPPFPPRGASASSRPWGDINGASFKIRREDETQAVSAHWRVLPLCVLSESHCNSTSSFFPFVFSPVESLFSFLSLATMYFSLEFFSIFSTFFIPQIHFSHSHVATQLPKGFTSVCEKSSNIPSVGFAFCVCVCVFSYKAALVFWSRSWLVFCGALAYQNLLSWERGTQSQPMHMEGESGAERKALWFSQSISRDQMRPHEYIWPQQPVKSSPSDCSFSENKQREPCILLEEEGFFHYAPTLWFQQLISTRQASLGLFSGLLCGQTSGLAVIALWVKAEIDHTGLVVVQTDTSQWNRQHSSQCLCQISQLGFPLVDLGPVTTIIMWNVCFPEVTVSL